MKKNLVISLSVLIILAAALFMNYYSKSKKYSEVFDGSFLFKISSIEPFYLEKGVFPTNYSEISQYLIEASSSTEDYYKPFMTDPFTKDYYKIVRITSDVKEENGILVLSAGFNGKFDNDFSEIKIEDISKLKVLSKKINNDYYKPTFMDYLYSDTDIVVWFYCDGMKYLKGYKDLDNTKLMTRSDNWYKKSSYVRLFIKGRLEEINESAKSIVLSNNGINMYCDGPFNMNKLVVGDTLNMSALLNTLEKEKFYFKECKIYPLELTSKNLRRYSAKIIDDLWKH